MILNERILKRKIAALHAVKPGVIRILWLERSILNVVVRGSVILIRTRLDGDVHLRRTLPVFSRIEPILHFELFYRAGVGDVVGVGEVLFVVGDAVHEKADRFGTRAVDADGRKISI